MSWTWTWTWMDAATCSWASSSAGLNGDRPRTHFPANPSPPSPPVPSSHSLRRVHQLLVAKDTGASCCCPDVEKNSSSIHLHFLATETP